MKKQFLFNPDNPKKSFDVYIDKNPADSIKIKYSSKSDVEKTIKKLESLYKNNKFTHKRISQVAMILMVRTRVIKDKNPKIDKGRAKLASDYFQFLKQRTKIKGDKERKKLKFSI